MQRFVLFVHHISTTGERFDFMPSGRRVALFPKSYKPIAERFLEKRETFVPTRDKFFNFRCREQLPD